MVEDKSKIVLEELELSDNIEFLKDRIAKRQTLIEQDRKAESILEEKGKDPRESFRVVGIEPKGEEDAVLRIITSGEEGEEKAREVLGSLKKHRHVSVVNDRVTRYNKGDEDVHRRCEELFRLSQEIRRLKSKNGV